MAQVMEFHWETRQNYIIEGNEKKLLELIRRKRAEEAKRKKKEVEQRILQIADNMSRITSETLRLATNGERQGVSRQPYNKALDNIVQRRESLKPPGKSSPTETNVKKNLPETPKRPSNYTPRVADNLRSSLNI